MNTPSTEKVRLCQNFCPIIFLALSQMLLGLLAIILSLTCDSTCWTSWFNNFYPGSADMWSDEEGIKKNYCENQSITSFDVWILTKSNSWSNYFFVLFGFIEITVAIKDFMLANEIKNASKINHVRKHPEWLVYHGLILIYGGVGSFAFHASYTKMGHLFDITAVFAMLGFPTTYAVLNLFLEELNRYFWIGDIVSKLAAPLSFIFSTFLGFWIQANRGNWEDFGAGECLALMAIILITALVTKWIKELRFEREYSINVWVLLGALVSIVIAGVCQEGFVDVPCDPESAF